jgi:hypothetical protein
VRKKFTSGRTSAPVAHYELKSATWVEDRPRDWQRDER